LITGDNVLQKIKYKIMTHKIRAQAGKRRNVDRKSYYWKRI